MKRTEQAFSIRVKGLVQGVGFRPFVWNLAHKAGITGRVLNDGHGVLIEASGATKALANFLIALEIEAPPLARIDEIVSEPLSGRHEFSGFKIAKSEGGDIATGIVADAATCEQCAGEIVDPDNHRFNYAFTNCTHCGPRLSIVKAIPYDRVKTAMANFTMCEQCRREYDDPTDRRYHAQPNACPDCGPKIWLEDSKGGRHHDNVIALAAERLKAGEIIAIKGIGGFHLCCLAGDDKAVEKLRQRKKRDAKPLALMVGDIKMVHQFAHVSEEEEKLLASSAAPIVLLKKRDVAKLASAIAPGHDRIGIMLAYSPLHILLMREISEPLVMTSGNFSGEPQVTQNGEAREKLKAIADAWLMHNRDIVNRLDDSVMRLDRSGPSILRRARGMAPEPILLTETFEDKQKVLAKKVLAKKVLAKKVLAMGGELKSSFALLHGDSAILSQHMGDLEEVATHEDYRKNLDLYRGLFDFAPDIIAIDRHSAYLSSQWGRAMAEEQGLKLVKVQHHHAHLASCLAEHKIPPGEDRSIGIVLDGLGLGSDGTIWGGEILCGGYSDFSRIAHFIPVALPGGASAIRQPWRNAMAHLKVAFGDEYHSQITGTGFADFIEAKPIATIEKMIDQKLNSPLSSSAGRLFDAAAALIGICVEKQDYEGQAGMALEALAGPYIGNQSGYEIEAKPGEDGMVFSWISLWRAMLDDLKAGRKAGIISARFHLALVNGLADFVINAAQTESIERIVLSGGVMQNALLLDGLFERLSSAGLEVLTQQKVPANDGGLALGQAVIAAVQVNH